MENGYSFSTQSRCGVGTPPRPIMHKKIKSINKIIKEYKVYYYYVYRGHIG